MQIKIETKIEMKKIKANIESQDRAQDQDGRLKLENQDRELTSRYPRGHKSRTENGYTQTEKKKNGVEKKRAAKPAETSKPPPHLQS